MLEIKLQGETRKMKFSHISLRTIESYYNMSISKVFDSVDLESLEALTVLLWACLRQYDKPLTLDDVDDLLDYALENNETTYEKISELLKTAMDNSKIINNSKKK